MSLAIASQLCLTQSPHCDGLYRDPVIDLYVSVDVFGTMECYSNFDSGFLQSYADQAKPMLWLKKSLVQPQGEGNFFHFSSAFGEKNIEVCLKKNRFFFLEIVLLIFALRSDLLA